MTHRATIQWRLDDGVSRMGLLRIGGPDFDHTRKDAWVRACAVHHDRASGVVEVEIWQGSIDSSMWRAMEVCFLRERIERYQFSRASGHWCCRRWDGARWIRDDSNPLASASTVPADSGKRSGVYEMSKNVTVIVEATNQDGSKHSKVTLETTVPDSAGVAAVQDAVNEGLKSLRQTLTKQC